MVWGFPVRSIEKINKNSGRLKSTVEYVDIVCEIIAEMGKPHPRESGLELPLLNNLE